MSTEDRNVTFYGFTAVPRDPEVLFKDHPTATGPNPKQDLFTVDDIPLPNSPLVREVREFVKVRVQGVFSVYNAYSDRCSPLSQRELNEQTYNHSHRVYVYG